jgi:galactose mutarotase-like enzyme
MKAASNRLEIREEQGFDLYVLANQEVEVTVVPALGAKIVSLKNLRKGREWMWHPRGGLKLFRNRRGDDFSKSPLSGLDECLPTIAPCIWQGRHLPDHGEAWCLPWDVDGAAWDEGLLRTSVRLQISPFEFQRTVGLRHNEIHFSYRLTNIAASEECFLWAMHPLLRLREGDQLQLPLSTHALLDGEIALDDPMGGTSSNSCVKAFASPVQEGFAAIHNSDTGDHLEFAWNPGENNTLGVWLTRGGWHGHEHFALEPSNGGADRLDLAAERGICGLIPAGQSRSWQVTIRVGC